MAEENVTRKLTAILYADVAAIPFLHYLVDADTQVHSAVALVTDLARELNISAFDAVDGPHHCYRDVPNCGC